MPIRWEKLRKTKYPGVWIRPEDGAYVIRVRHVDPRTKKQSDIIRTLEGAMLDEALAKRGSIERLVKEGAYAKVPAAPRETLTAFAQRWLRRKRTDGVREGTLGHYLRVLESFILPHLGELLVDSITSRDIFAWRDKVGSQRKPDGSSYSHWTMAGWMAVLRNLLSDAAVEFELPRDPAKGVPGFRKPRSPRAKRYLRPDELKTFLALVEEHWPEHYALTVFLAAYGLRWGEATALSRADVDWEAGELRVARSHVRGSVTPTKSDSIRLLPLSDRLRMVLEGHLRRTYPEDHITSAEDLLFPNRDGNYRTPSSVSRAWRDVSSRMKHPWELKPHDLRRTCSNLLRLAGAGLVTAQALLGHSSNEMSLHYSHVGMEEKRAGLDNVFSLLGYRTEKMKDSSKDAEEGS